MFLACLLFLLFKEKQKKIEELKAQLKSAETPEDAKHILDNIKTKK